MNMMMTGMASEGYAEAERRWSELKSARSGHEALWDDIARLLRPQRGRFGMTDKSPGHPEERPLSSAPIHAQSSFAAGLYGTLTNPAAPWHGFETNDTDVNAWHPARVWLDAVAKRVLDSFNASVSPFYSQVPALYGDLASFGNAAQYDEVLPAERKILDITLSLSEVCVEIDAFGRVCEVVRRFRLTPRQAMGMFQKAGDYLPPKMMELAEAGDTTRHVFFHHIRKNEAWEQGRLGPRGKRWTSRYSCEVERCLVRMAGYDEMPFYFPRWEVETGETYGVGPGFVALASARVHNRMDDATIRAAQRAADPTILAPDRRDWPLEGRIVPGSVLYGAMNGNTGQQVVRPLETTGGGFNLTLQEKQAKLEEIKDAFHYTLMQLSGRSGMTATETMQIVEERQRLWAPHMGRVQDEYLARKVERRFALLWRAGQIPPPPEGLPEGLELRVTYKSAAAAAQRSTEGTAALRVLQDIAPLIQIDPRFADRLDADGLLEVLIDARGAPARMVRSREEADALAEARAQAQQAAQLMTMGEQGAGMLKDVAGAQAAMAGQGGAQG